MKKRVQTKRRLKMKNFLILSLVVLFFFAIFFFLWNLPTRAILITGTSYLSDQEIIETAGLKEFPPIFQIHRSRIRKNLLALDYIDRVVIHQNLLGILTLEITEEKPIFYHRTKEKLVLETGKMIDSQELQGVPILVNYVPDELYERMVSQIRKMDSQVLHLISEIEYQPWKSGDVTIDDTRFVLRMNDGNLVYVNLINWDKLNNYMTIYSTLNNAKGVLQLDSSLGNGITFTPF